MSKVAKSIFKYFAILFSGAVIGFALLFWYLNHSQCEGLTWNGELGAPIMIPADRLNCMRTGPILYYEGVWEIGHELNEFYPIESKSNEILLPREPLVLEIDEATHFLIREKLNIDSDIREPQKFRITFYANLMTNYHKGYSAYRNHYDVRKIESMSVFDGDLPSER